jgi:UDP-2,3-diacylglucosamine pyrophosphatase LpxH
MPRTKRVFISDIHQNAKKAYEDGFSWYVPNSHGPRLLQFLEKEILAKARRIKDLVLLGDIFDGWVWPCDPVPAEWIEIVRANLDFCDRIAEISKAGVNVFWSPGNHDYDIPKWVLQRHLPYVHEIAAYKGAGRVHAEHGHLHSLFNCMDWLNDPAYGLPIGYYITRFATTVPGNVFDRSSVLGYVDDLAEAVFTPATIFESILEGISERADTELITMREGRDGTFRTLDELKERYKGLADQHGLGLWGIASSALAEGNLEKVGDELCAKMGFNVCIFGHTHKAKIDKDWFGVEDRIYANAGTWCGDRAHCVVVDKPKRKLSYNLKVSLCEVADDGTICDTRSETL